MLVSDLYRVKHFAVSDGIKAVLEIQSGHPIFKGHFPEVSVLPGVCMIQIIKEMIEQSINVQTTLSQTNIIKFLSMVNPEVNNELLVDIHFKEQSVTEIVYSAVMKNSESLVMKCSGRLHIN